jgi:hypothetical protein
MVTFAKKNGRWQMVQIQGTSLHPTRTAVPVDSALLDAYARRYVREDIGVEVVISRRGGTLVVRSPDLGDRVLTPVSETRFFDKAGGDRTFYRESSSDT